LATEPEIFRRQNKKLEYVDNKRAGWSDELGGKNRPNCSPINFLTKLGNTYIHCLHRGKEVAQTNALRFWFSTSFPKLSLAQSGHPDNKWRQGCQIFWGATCQKGENLPKPGKLYQIDQMAIKNTQTPSIAIHSKFYPNWYFYWKLTIWQPWVARWLSPCSLGTEFIHPIKIKSRHRKLNVLNQNLFGFLRSDFLQTHFLQRYCKPRLSFVNWFKKVKLHFDIRSMAVLFGGFKLTESLFYWENYCR
jgi:hypothetical protein